jgi:hypothetical protein
MPCGLYGAIGRGRGEQGNIVNSVLSRIALYRSPIETGAILEGRRFRAIAQVLGPTRREKSQKKQGPA